MVNIKNDIICQVKIIIILIIIIIYLTIIVNFKLINLYFFV